MQPNLDVDLDAVEIEFSDVLPDDLAAWAAKAPLWSGVPTPFGPLDPEAMSHAGCLDATLALERIKAWADAQQARILARMADRPEPVPVRRGESQRHVAGEFRDEVACALHVSFGVAHDRIEVAQALVNRLPATLALLEDGAISHVHCRRLVRAVADSDDKTAAAVEERVLPRAPKQTPAEFARSVQRAVHRLDPRERAEKHADAAQHRHLRARELPDGMAELTMVGSAQDVQTIIAAVQAVADGYPADDLRTADQKRADALVDIAAATLNGCTVGDLPTRQGRKPAVQITIALSTLLYLDEQCAELDGHGPIPADIARTLATELSATWRTLITDDAGRLLDYGRTVYRPPTDLREFVIARDRTCRIPGCSRTARRTDIDHRIRWTDGGTTSPGNLQPLCEHHHAAKDDGGWRCDMTDDGTTVWTSPLGKRHEKPAETYPQDLTVEKMTRDDEPPPF